MRVQYEISFQDYLEARCWQETEDDAAPSYHYDMTRPVLFLLGCTVLLALSLESVLILGIGGVLIIVVVCVREFFQSRANARHLAALRSEYQRLSSGLHTLEADARGWKLSSPQTERVYSWDQVQIVEESSRVLCLITSVGPVTLPKASFTAEQQARLKAWCQIGEKP